MKKFFQILNDARPAKSAKMVHCCIRNKEDTSKPVEVLIYDDIGKDWDGTGFDAKDFVAQIKDLDQNRELHVRVNSRGGEVDQGIAIYNRLREWKGKTVAVVDGSAASIASVIIMGADEVHMPKSAQILIHEAHAIAYGNADEMRVLAERLDNASDRIAGIYADKSGKPREDMRNYMRKTSVFNGQQAKDLGLADVLTDEVPLYNFSPEEISRFREEMGRKQTPEADAKQGADSKQKDPMRDTIIALLNKLGIQFDNKATDAQLFALAEPHIKAAADKKPDNTEDPTIKALRQSLELVTNKMETERKTRITAAIDELVENNQLPAANREKAITRAMADETILDEYRALPSTPPGAAPIAVVDLKNSDPRDVAKHILALDAPVKSWQRGNAVPMDKIRDAAMARALAITENMKRLQPLLNTNTVATELKRNVILQTAIVDFARRLLPLRAFSVVFESVPLEGTNKVEVPFYDLDSTASRSFANGTGYTQVGNTTTDKREITIGQGAADGDRLFQDLSFTSEEIARQPYLKIEQLARLKADKLASDVFTDVLGIVTLANFGAAAINSPAIAFDSSDLADLKLACKLWPEMGRSLMLDSAYDANLMKDPVFSTNLNAGAGVVRDGSVGKRAYGFDYYEIPTIPSNSENLVGLAVFQSAILVATAPVPPVDEVRNAGTTYNIVVDPNTGIAFEYRSFGDNVKDSATHIIECNYGFAKGNANALKRIVSA